MLTYDLKRAKKAVQYLVDDTFGKHHIRRIRTYVKRPRAMPFKMGDSEVLNELVVIGRQNTTALENLLELVEHKRDDRGDYQREYMAQKRGRERKVIALEEFLVDRVLSLEERRQLLLKQTELWSKERAKYIDDAAKSHLRGTGQQPSWLEKTGFIKAFWAIKDRELDEILEEAKRQAAQPVHRKRVVNVPPPRPVHNPQLHDQLMKMEGMTVHKRKSK